MMNTQTRLKAYIMSQFKKFIKNTSVLLKDKDHKKYSFNSNKAQDRPKKEYKEVGQNSAIPSRPKCFGC